MRRLESALNGQYGRESPTRRMQSHLGTHRQVCYWATFLHRVNQSRPQSRLQRAQLMARRGL